MQSAIIYPPNVLFLNFEDQAFSYNEVWNLEVLISSYYQHWWHFFYLGKTRSLFFFIAQRALWLKICAFKNNRIVKLKYVVDWKFWHGFIQFLLWYIYNSKGMIFTFVKQIALKYSQKHSDVKDRYRCQSG